MSELLRTLIHIAETLRTAQTDTRTLETERNHLIRLLHADGYNLAGLARAAGISRQRAWQIAQEGEER